MKTLTLFAFATCVLFQFGFSFAQATESSWSQTEISKLKKLSIPVSGKNPALKAKPSPGNRFADNADAAALGRLLFFDSRLSGSGKLSCASCHQPERAYSDNMSAAQGENLTIRNTPTLIGSANDKWWFWDGRADSLWAQALLPFEAPDEMAGSRIAILQLIATDEEYRRRYENLFGKLPSSEVYNRLDNKASPAGNLTSRTAWYQINQNSREQITAAYVNLGKAIEAYERTLLHIPTRFDRFARKIITLAKDQDDNDPVVFESSLLTAEEIQGLKLYLDDQKTHCRNCHNGPRFSNSEFYDVGTGRLTGSHLDLGRSFGLPAVRQSEFNCLGPYSDVPEADKSRACRIAKVHTSNSSAFLLGAFKTPTLRELGKSAPYFHDGSMESLQDVVGHYQSIDANRSKNSVQLNAEVQMAKQESALPPFSLSKQEATALVAFLLTLSSP